MLDIVVIGGELWGEREGGWRGVSPVNAASVGCGLVLLWSLFSRSFTTRPLHHRTAVLSSVVTETRVLPIQGSPVVHRTILASSSLAHSFSTSLTFTGGSYNTEPLSFLSLRFPFECWLEGQTLESSGLTNRRTRKQQ